MRSRKKRQLTKAELRAMGATPGLMSRRIGPDGRAKLEQLTAESAGARTFARRLTDDTKASEGSE